MIDLRRYLVAMLSLCAAVVGMLEISAADESVAAVDFSRDIRPILSDSCFHCHGPDAEHREADLRLDVREGALVDLGGYAAIVPGDSGKSELLSRLLSEDPDELMPPPDSGKELTKEQIELIRRWIDQGADWPQHWAFVSPVQSKLPQVNNHDWPNNDIDHFVLAKLDANRLQPSERADRRTLARRLSFDLTGLPPTLKQLDAFLSDQSEDAYERYVDRLLSSQRFGERMALAWLDQARYADTNGFSIDGGRHMWLWRDWVIDAYNKNMPFDQFLTEQLAGDLLPESTVQQKVATGFNRNHMITHEGGTIPEENLVNYAVDRVKTTAEVFLGLTMGCAQCHDHKYDPLSQKDFYSFFAYFNTLDDRGLDGNSGINAGPKIEATSILGLQEAKQIKQRLEQIEKQMRQPLESQSAWQQAAIEELDNLGHDFQIHELETLKISTPNRTAPKLEEDGSVLSLSSGSRSPSLLLKAKGGKIAGLRVEFYPRAELPGGGVGHGNDKGFEGSFVLSSFSASADAIPSPQFDLNKQVPIARVTASNSHVDYPPANCLDPRDHNGWSPHPHNKAKQHITFTFDEPIDTDETPYITTLMVWGGGEFGGGAALSPGHFRVFAITGTDQDTNLPADVQSLLRKSSSELTDEESLRLQEYYASIAPELANLRYERENLKERLAVMSESHQVMVMNTSAKPRETHILNRGQYDQPGEKVTPEVPECLPSLPGDAPSNRLGLARWMTEPNHPLTCASGSQSDFGNCFLVRGSFRLPPILARKANRLAIHSCSITLAVDFVESGWDVKRMIKQIVLSSTYQQSSHVSSELLQVDPQRIDCLPAGRGFDCKASL